jgi:hypothetical protein
MDKTYENAKYKIHCGTVGFEEAAQDLEDMEQKFEELQKNRMISGSDSKPYKMNTPHRIKNRML